MELNPNMSQDNNDLSHLGFNVRENQVSSQMVSPSDEAPPIGFLWDSVSKTVSSSPNNDSDGLNSSNKQNLNMADGNKELPLDQMNDLKGRMTIVDMLPRIQPSIEQSVNPIPVPQRTSSKNINMSQLFPHMIAIPEMNFPITQVNKEIKTNSNVADEIKPNGFNFTLPQNNEQKLITGLDLCNPPSVEVPLPPPPPIISSLIQGSSDSEKKEGNTITEEIGFKNYNKNSVSDVKTSPFLSVPGPTNVSASRESLNRLLDSLDVKQYTQPAEKYNNFPLNRSLQELPDESDGNMTSCVGKPCRDRAQERMNSSLISEIFYSKPKETILKLIEDGASIHTKCRDSGATPLHVAALIGNIEIVELLISKGCDVKSRDRKGKQAIHIAAWEGSLSVIKMISEADEDMVRSSVEPEEPFTIVYPDSWNHKHEQISKHWSLMESIPSGSTPLHVACRRTKEPCVKFLIDCGAETSVEDSKGLYPVDVIGVDVVGDSAVSDSTDGSIVGIAKLLISHQKSSSAPIMPKLRKLLSVEDHDLRPVTALHTAVNDNNLNLITILLDEGADVLVWNEGGATPLHLAVKKKFLDALRLMLRHGDHPERRVVDAVDNKGISLLYLAVEEEWNDGISVLLEENADVTWKNYRRETVLHLAAASGNSKILEELLTVPNVLTIVNDVDIDYYTPIHKAVENDYQRAVEILLKNGANAEVLLPDSRTLLHICAKNNAEELLQFLMESTGLKDMKDNKTSFEAGGMTALHLAASSGFSDIIILLLKYGCDLGSKTNDGTGSTPLHLASKFDKADVLKTILNYDHAGLALEAQDDHGWYPLHIAAGHGHEECVDLLLRAGADIALTVEDEQGTKFTGLDIIMTCVHKPVDFLVRILDSHIIVDTKVPVTNPRCKIEVDFDFLLPSPPRGKQLGVLESVLNNGSEDLEEAFFLHPLVQTFIHLKSQNMFLFFALFFLIFFSLAFYLSLVAYHGAIALQQPLYRYTLIGILSINMLFEVINMIRLQRYYLTDPETWIKWCVYFNILVIVINPTGVVLRYNLAICILLCWTELLLIIAKYPAWGIYVLMFATVAGTIFKVLIVFSLLLVGFAFTFRALFQDKGPFNSFWSSFVKVIIMVYELDYRGTMEETKDEGAVFSDVARLFYLVFVLMVSVSLVNLILGLAVSDIADLKRKGRAKRLAKQVAFLGGLENLLYRWPLSSLPLVVRYRKAPKTLVVKAGNTLDKATDPLLPKPLKEAIIERARSVQQSIQNQPTCAHTEIVITSDTASIATKKSLSASYRRLNI